MKFRKCHSSGIEAFTAPGTSGTLSPGDPVPFPKMLALLCLVLGASHPVLAEKPAATPAGPGAQGLFFDDFSYANAEAMIGHGWIIRTKAGYPGLPGGQWGPGTVMVIEDPKQQGNRVARLLAETSGAPENTKQAQICQARKFLEGTYAARIRLTDKPALGPRGDVVIETFYVVGSLKHDFDPEYSELDWEYLPNGGWGNAKPRLYSTSWQTVQLNPWKAFNQHHEEFGNIEGWHILMMQVSEGRIRYFVDGKQVAEHGGRNYPVVPMSLNFNLWYADGGLLPDVKDKRVYHEDIDWVFHARNQVLSPGDLDKVVKAYRASGTSFVDTVPAADPPMPCTCDF